MDEATRERILDARIQRRLASDRAYRWAENAEEQADCEREIENEEDARLDRELEQAQSRPRRAV